MHKGRSWRIILPLTKENIFFIVLKLFGQNDRFRDVELTTSSSIGLKKVSTGAFFHSMIPKSLKCFSTSFATTERCFESLRAAT